LGGVPSQPLKSLISGILTLAQERDACRRGRDHQRTRLIFGQQRLKAGAQGLIRQPFDHVGVALLLPARASPLRPPREQRSWWRALALPAALRSDVPIPAKRAAAFPQHDCGKLSPGRSFATRRAIGCGLGSVAGGVLFYLCGYRFPVLVAGHTVTQALTLDL